MNGQRLAIYRAHLGLSQRELSRRLGYANDAVNRWERSKGTMPLDAQVRLLTIIRDLDALERAVLADHPDLAAKLDGCATAVRQEMPPALA